jgi:hypothetical protein
VTRGFFNFGTLARGKVGQEGWSLQRELTALITGASSVIGAEVAFRFVTKGGYMLTYNYEQRFSTQFAEPMAMGN